MAEPTKVESLFLPVQAGRAGEDIALQIEAAIMDGRLAPGTRLPSEREMQTQFGTGRGVVREAVKVLKQKGLLEVRKGAKGGAYVCEVGVRNVSESLAIFLKQHPVEPEKLIEFRETLDRAITQLAIARGTEEEKQELLREACRLETILREDEPDLVASSELDRRLNLMHASMARNPLFEWLMHTMQMGFGSHDNALYDTPEFREKAAANWSETARAIADNEPMRALSLISHHYVLLRQCVARRGDAPHEPEVSFLKDDNSEN